MGKNKGQILIILGALIGVLLIVYGGLRLQKRPVAHVQNDNAKATIVPVVMAARQILRGQTISAADLGSTNVYGAPPTGALRAPAEAVGRIAVTDIPANQLVLGPLISTDPAAAGLALQVPQGQRAISLITSDEIAVADYIRPGDHVDIQTVLRDDILNKNGANRSGEGDRSEARTVLHDIQVLAVGGPVEPAANAKDRNGAPPPPPRNRQPTVTVAMTPADVARFTLARSLGPYYLALRNPKDNGATTPENLARLIDIRGVAAPMGPVRAILRRPAAPPRGPIDVVVGGHAQVIYPGAGK
jgi:pilus assembly protein CpaB